MLPSQKFNKELYPEDFTEKDKERFIIIIARFKAIFTMPINNYLTMFIISIIKIIHIKGYF